jgi:antitoxin (DNA-binding transcriptional repressor) of toxin-antitoxin stability system
MTSPAPDWGAAEISQRDLRNRSAEIMDALEAGRRFSVTRNGHHIGDLVPVRERRTFVSRTDFAEMSMRMPQVDYGRFRADLDRNVDDEAYDPFERALRRDQSPEEA